MKQGPLLQQDRAGNFVLVRLQDIDGSKQCGKGMAMSQIPRSFLNFPRFASPAPAKHQLNHHPGSAAVVTGGNAGVGLATARALVARGARVVIACRDMDKGGRAAATLRGVAPAPGVPTAGACSVLQLDLADLANVARAAEQLAAEGGAEIVVLNAGVMAPPERLETGDGFELQYQTNFLGHFLLANRLACSRRRRRRVGEALPPATYVWLTSVTAFASQLSGYGLQGLPFARQYHAFGQYANTKLACMLCAAEMNARLATDEGRAASVHPGLVDTFLARTYFKSAWGGALPMPLRPLLNALLDRVLCPLFLRRPKDAAALVVRAATAPDKVVAGRYLAGRGVATPPAKAGDADLRQALWACTRDLCLASGAATNDDLL